MGTFKKEISQHTQKQFMGKICAQWSEIIIHLSVGKATEPMQLWLTSGKENTPVIFPAKKVCGAHCLVFTLQQQVLEAFFSRYGTRAPCSLVCDRSQGPPNQFNLLQDLLRLHFEGSTTPSSSGLLMGKLFPNFFLPVCLA